MYAHIERLAILHISQFISTLEKEEECCYFRIYIYVIIRVRTGGYYTPSRISKTLFSNPFFYFFEKSYRHPRIEFSPANKKKKRMCSYARIEFSCVFLRTKNNQKKQFLQLPNEKRRFRFQKTVFTTPLTLPLTSLTSNFR